MNKNYKNTKFNLGIAKSYNQTEFKLVYKNDAKLKPYQKSINIKNDWRTYAEKFEEYAPFLETSSNLYQIDTLKFLKNSKIQPIFLCEDSLKIKVPRIYANGIEQNWSKFNNIHVNWIPKTLFNLKKNNLRINLMELNGSIELKKVYINKKVLEKTSKPLTYYLVDKLKKQHI